MASHANSTSLGGLIMWVWLVVQARNIEEREWCTVDRIVNPELYQLVS
jgi:hypothetical protein